MFTTRIGDRRNVVTFLRYVLGVVDVDAQIFDVIDGHYMSCSYMCAISSSLVVRVGQGRGRRGPERSVIDLGRMGGMPIVIMWLRG